MEQIEKALARAREMRSASIGNFRAANSVNSQPSTNGVTPEYTETVVSAADRGRMIEQRLIADSPAHPASDIYRLLRTQVLQRMKKSGMTTLAVTSPAEGSGVTTTAANLAIAIALDVNQTVLLVDINMRSPGIHKKFGLEPKTGIDDYLHGGAQLKDCLVSPGMSRLVILPAIEVKGGAAEIISSPRMTALAKELQSRYSDRIIIYDTPPLLASSDTLGFLPNVHGVLLVARSGQTTKEELDRTANMLKSNTIVGTLLNAH
jgi:protein-tyrosine kinase